MSDKSGKKVVYGRDPKVTAISLIVIAIQSLIIAFGFIYRWEWIQYEFAAMLIIPAIIVVYKGVQAVLRVETLMSDDNKGEDKEDAR